MTIRAALKYFFVMTGFVVLSFTSPAQSPPVDVNQAVDPTWVRSSIVFDFGSYIYHQPARFYAAGFGYRYGLQNGRHLFGLAVPFVHSVFDKDLQGFENTVGIGDIRMFYMGSFPAGESLGLTRIAPYLKLSAPTGEYKLGRGAGSWLYKPGMIFTFNLHPNVSFFPEVGFQFSGEEVNTRGGANGTPDLEDGGKDEALKNLTIIAPVVLKLESARAWFGIDAEYINSFEESEYFIFFGTQAGLMLGDKTLGSLKITKFVAGLPRINVVVEAKLQFFL